MTGVQGDTIVTHKRLLNGAVGKKGKKKKRGEAEVENSGWNVCLSRLFKKWQPSLSRSINIVSTLHQSGTKYAHQPDRCERKSSLCRRLVRRSGLPVSRTESIQVGATWTTGGTNARLQMRYANIKTCNKI